MGYTLGRQRDKTQNHVRLARLRGFADFQGVRSLFINEIDEKVFTTSGSVGDGDGGDFGRRLGRQLEPELPDQKLKFRLGLGVGVSSNSRPSVVGRCTSIIWTAANFSNALRAVSPGAYV
jgi:hypothetical protein